MSHGDGAARRASSPPGDELLPLLAAGAVVGASQGSHAELAVADGRVCFRGTVVPLATFYGGDCAAAWSSVRPIDLGGARGLALRGRGDGRPYIARLRTTDSFADVVYQADFETSPDTAFDVELPFACFRPISLASWSALPGHPPLDPARVTSLGLATYWQAGPFLLELESLSAPRAIGEAESPPRSREADLWERWVDVCLFPLALRAAELPPSTTPADVFASAEARRADRRIPCYESAAECRSEALVVFAAARTAARRAGSARASQAAEAALYLLMEAAYELAIAADLAAETWSATGTPPRDFLAREAVAEGGFERWASIDAEIADSLEAAGLEVDPEE
jgi:monofunctional biosynthetic peptidoglycan transglycosylase